MMVPAAVTGQTVEVLGELVEAGDTLIDGGSSYYRDDIERAEKLEAAGVHYLDVGTSGGIWGLERGYCLMIGGEKDVIGRSPRSSPRSLRGRARHAHTGSDG